MAEKLFCSKPFQWFEVSGWQQPKGDIYLCCPQWLDTSVGNLQRQSVEEVWNGEGAQAIRESILDGSFSYCSQTRCPYLKSKWGPVQSADSVTDPKLRQVIDERLTVLPWGPQEINCAFDKSCNLSCPTCRTDRIIETDQADPIRYIRNKLEREALPEARYLSITGSGDAFGSPFFNEWLRTMQFERTPKLEHIHLHTNAQLWTPRMWSQIPEIVRERIHSAEISIDAASPETYAINRRGGSFDRLLENLAFVKTLRSQGPLGWLTVSMVVQENNFVEMPDFVRLGQSFAADLVYFSQLVNWGTFSDEEFRNRAVHLDTHPRHGELREVLSAPIFEEEQVNLGNLLNLRQVRDKRVRIRTMPEPMMTSRAIAQV